MSIYLSSNSRACLEEARICTPLCKDPDSARFLGGQSILAWPGLGSHATEETEPNPSTTWLARPPVTRD